MDEETIPFGCWAIRCFRPRHPPARAHLVPVGKDNQAHVEITREIARRFNNQYGELFLSPMISWKGTRYPHRTDRPK